MCVELWEKTVETDEDEAVPEEFRIRCHVTRCAQKWEHSDDSQINHGAMSTYALTRSQTTV